MTRIIGLTGGIGTGKSTVAKMFVALGARLVDADAIVHELQAPGTPTLVAIQERFGPEVIDADGALDRAALGAIVFRDADARRALGEIVHPPVRREMRARIERAVAEGVALVLVDIPLLFEGRRGTDDNPLGLEATILVYAPRALQIDRQRSRDGSSLEEAERRVAAQLPIEDKRALADHVIDNGGGLDDTRRQVEALYRELTEAPRRPAPL
ncbi:MAG: dephospho-CoA kinase [Myxococcales bacterium]|nr:dephospho-CoA kinase [Myxococcales bacterium]